MDQNGGVYLGTWINWSRGPVFGATLTLTRENGNLLIAFTAFYVGLVSSRFWRIFCLAFHRYYSTPTPQDGLFHQRQAILRNSATPESSLLSLGQLYWAWRRSAQRALWRMLPTFIFALLSIIAFTAASGFSSRISTAIGNEVLLDGTNCGILRGFSTDTVPGTIMDAAVLNAYVGTHMSNVAKYAQQCYGPQTSRSDMFDCASFIIDQLPMQVNESAECPFKDGICRSENSNIRLDSGYIDSRDHLGLNAPKHHSIQIRRVFHCAPLRTEGYTSDVVGLNQSYTRYHYGYSHVPDPVHGGPSNYTYEADTLEVQYGRNKDNLQRNDGINYIIVPEQSFTINGTADFDESDFMPIDALTRSDGDVYLVFLVGNGVQFMNPSQDDWYRATAPGTTVTNKDLNTSSTSFQPVEAASPLGCVEQFQFCNAALPPESRCGPLASLRDASAGAAPLFGNLTPESFRNNVNDTSDNMEATRYLQFMATLIITVGSPSEYLVNLKAKALMSQETMASGWQMPIPDNQWKLDVTYWMSIWLAALQSSFVDVAVGTADPVLKKTLLGPRDPYQREMCNNQKIQTSGYTSFSLFGLYFVLVGGLVVIITSYVLEPVLHFVERRRMNNHYKHMEWIANETLHLQNLGFQGLGRGTWSRYTDDVPITEQAVVFESLALGHDGDVKEESESSGEVVSQERGYPLKTTTPLAGGFGSMETINHGSESGMVQAHHEVAPEHQPLYQSLTHVSTEFGAVSPATTMGSQVPGPGSRYE
ncbi:hypothetical protein B0T19DRAFT_488545 [Cercophora scortea]|uniref:Uncharacterized protein n=1 Tax=Cercophora scortea TaxID=314031 RepID=A0AAE0I303_9PEZI|nr:hypothetical protein B0T19DRAFT_488545 [Cercophora scortea]